MEAKVQTVEEWLSLVKESQRGPVFLRTFLNQAVDPVGQDQKTEDTEERLLQITGKLNVVSARIILSTSMPGLAECMSTAGISTNSIPAVGRWDILLHGKSLSAGANAKGTELGPEHLWDGKMEALLKALSTQAYQVNKRAACAYSMCEKCTCRCAWDACM